MNPTTPIVALVAATKVFGVRHGQPCHAPHTGLNLASV